MVEYDGRNKTSKLIDILIHEYMTKNRYVRSADTFRLEASITDYPDTGNSSLLEEWFDIFNELSNIRSGSFMDRGSLANLEAIMMRILNEKKKYKSRAEFRRPEEKSRRGYFPFNEKIPQNYYSDQMRYQHEMMRRNEEDQKNFNRRPDEYAEYHEREDQKKNYYDKMDYPYYERKTPEHPGFFEKESYKKFYESPEIKRREEKAMPKVKEIKEFNFPSRKITNIVGLKELKAILFSTTDRMIQIIDLKTMRTDISFEPHQNLTKEIKTKEDDGKAIFATFSMENEIKIFSLVREPSSGSLNVKLITTISLNNVVSTISLDENYLYAVDIESEMSKYTLDGNFISSTKLQDEVKHMVPLFDNLFLISDRSLLFVFDFEKRTVLKQLIKESPILVKESNGNYIVLLKDYILTYDSKLYKTRDYKLSDRAYCCTVIDEGNILVGGYEEILFCGELNTAIKLPNKSISAIEVLYVFNTIFIVAGTSTGEIILYELVLK